MASTSDTMAETPIEADSGPPTPEDLEKREPTRLPFSRTRALLTSFAIVLIQFVGMIPYGTGINSSIAIGISLHATPAQTTWLAASYPLTQGAFLLMGGRLGTIYGHKNILMLATAWWVIFHITSGFARNLIVLCVFRGLAGIGAAFMAPNSLALLTTTFPPGKWRNVTVSMFGAMAPVGAAGGSVLPGFFTQLLPWKWLFFFLAMFGAAIFTLFYFVVPSEGKPFDPTGKMDWIGAFLSTGALILFNFTWNQAPAVGWGNPYEYILLIVSVLMFAAFLVWEAKFASQPILPFGIWKAPSFLPMIIAATLVYMGAGIAIWYVNVWLETVRNYSNLLTAAAYAPLAVGGCLVAILSGRVIRLIPAQYMMAIGGLASCISLILFSTMPAHQTYWAQVFPGMCIIAFGPDFVFTAAQIIASNAVKRRHQGIAGALIGVVASWGLSTGLGFAGTVEVHTNKNGSDLVGGYRHAMYLGVGISALAILLALVFVRIPKDERDGWDDDDRPDDEGNRGVSGGNKEKEEVA